MIVWTCKPELLITSDIEPQTAVRKPLPSDSEAEKKDKRNFPYINKRAVKWHIDYLGLVYDILIPKGFLWNGTNCIGLQYHPKLLNASMVHDALCNDHSLVGNDRQLSSIIFRELGIASGASKAFMWVAYSAVDNYQKIFGRDLEGNGWLY